MRSDYTPSNWYWAVAGSKTQVFSSAATAYVQVTDPTYVAWLAAGYGPTAIGAEQDLWDVLYAAGVAIPAAAVASDVAKTAMLAAVDVATLKTVLNHENRIRVLEGKAAVTPAQFVTAVKSLM